MDFLTRTHDITHITADPDIIFRLAADIEHWPEILPHYRWVRVLRQDPACRVVEMAARRGFIPVKWRAVQQVFLKERRITYRHIEGATRGMYVEWLVEPASDGGVRVEIVHDLTLETPLVKTPIGKFIVARIFIKHIAQKTLLFIKRTAENGCLAKDA